MRAMAMELLSRYTAGIGCESTTCFRNSAQVAPRITRVPVSVCLAWSNQSVQMHMGDDAFVAECGTKANAGQRDALEVPHVQRRAPRRCTAE